jgi:hypothetical protein
MAAQVEIGLRSLEAVIAVHANPTTGNVLVLYNSQRLTQDQVLAALQALGCFQHAAEVPGGSSRPDGTVGSQLAEQLALSAAGWLFELALGVLVRKLG